MIIIEFTKELQDQIAFYKRKGLKIGFVPTMGALHQGHLSLIEASKKECDITISSVFVNPTQFNEKDDYDKYPRSIKSDKAMLKSEGCDIVFIPSYREMYPETDTREFDFGALATVMEGAHRPGHFNGVAQIVSKLFDAVPADKAFFGQKDFQQYVIIKDLVRQLDLEIEIIACPIIREESGLAMSSRNERLSTTDRILASHISEILSWAKDNYLQFSISDLKIEVEKMFSKYKGLDLEYFEIVDDESLKTVQIWESNRKIVACVAVFCGNVRLIDNIVFNL